LEKNMKNAKRLSVLALALAAGLPASAQAPKMSGLVQIWYTQMMDNNLRLNRNTYDDTGRTPMPYDIRSEFRENGFSIRRTEIKLAGSVGDDVEWEVMFDPTITSTPILQDAAVKYKLPNRIEFRVGQFKNMQTLEGLTSSSELMLIERSQLAKRFGDVRDRGVVASMGFGNPKAVAGRAYVGMFNANAKNNDNNAQKDIVARLEMTFGKLHSFGAYTLQGSTNQQDTGALKGATFSGSGAPTSAEVLDGKDATSQMGAYYRFQNDKIHASAELITGQIGRLYPSLTTSATDGVPGSPNLNRKHLDQQFLGYVATVGYTFGKHSVIGRFDMLNYNSGDQWYGATNPYVNTLDPNSDYTPTYTEITLGYTYAFMPEKLKNANIKANYVMRSKNFLRPRADQTGEQGGDTFYLCFQTAF
jgi:hypothetical protein